MRTTRLILSISALCVALHVQAPANPAPGRLVCFFLDMNAMDAAEQATARDSAIQFVQRQAQPSDRIAVMTYTSELNVLHDFTSDRDGVLAALRMIMPAGNGTGDTASRLQAIRAGVTALSLLPDKKAMIYFSSGVPRNGGDDSEIMRATVNAAIRANVSIYSVDSRGLTPPQ